MDATAAVSLLSCTVNDGWRWSISNEEVALQCEVDRPSAIVTTAVNQDLRRGSGQGCCKVATEYGIISAVLNKANLLFDVSEV